MPTLTRFVIFLIVCAAIVYAAAYGLANFVRPTKVEERIELPIEELLERAERRYGTRPGDPSAAPEAEGQNEANASDDETGKTQ